MIATPELIEALAANAAPVRRLRAPIARAALWLAFALLIVGLLGLSHGVRPDLAERMRHATFVLGLTGSVLTGIFAAVAAFLLSLPDRSRSWILLPVPTLVLWLSATGYGCFTNWVAIGPEGVRLGETARCFATLVLTSAPLWLAALVMLRHAALVRPRLVASLAGLAVGGLSATALTLFHDLSATAMVLLWNIGVAALAVGFGGALGRRMFSWVAPLPAIAARS